MGFICLPVIAFLYWLMLRYFDDFSYRYEPDAERPNTVEMLIREKRKA